MTPSKFRLHTPSGEVLAVPEDAHIEILLDSDGLFRMRTELLVKSADIETYALHPFEGRSSAGTTTGASGGVQDFRTV